MTLGGVLVFGVGSVVWLSFRDNPEQCGLRMDGDAASDGGSEAVPARPGPTRDEAIRTLSFWVVTLSLALHGMMITGITFHIVDLGAQGGLDRTESVSIFLPMAAISTTLGALVGVISDRVSIRAIIAAMLVSLAVAFVATAHLGSPALFATAVASLGVAGGIFGPLSTIAMPRLFGRTHLGAIAGAQMMAMVVASALGPAYLALSMDAFGSYTPALYGACVLPAGLLGLTLYARLPDRPSAASGRGRPRERDEPADRSEP
jgi:sugar phosphate permease